MSDTLQAVHAHGPSARSADWPRRFFEDADAFDVDVLARWFAPAIEVRFGNAPPIHGEAEAKAAFAQFFGAIAGRLHVGETQVCEGDTVSQQSVVTYSTLDGREVSLPVSSYLRRTDDGRLDRLWIYIDMAPLFAQAGSG